jgi:SP family galactose:H+ symporter-like MFS transporter
LFVRHEFGLSNFEQGALVSVLPLGAMAGGLFAGRLADALGRRVTLIVDALVFIAGTALAVAASSSGLLLVARAATGVAVGVSSSTVPVYLAEIAPPGMRGRLVTVNQLMVTFGIAVSYCVDLLFAGSGSWRAMFAIGFIPAAGLLVAMLRSPETPAWLAGRGRTDAARTLIIEVAGEQAAEELLRDFQRSQRAASKQSEAFGLLRSAARPALVIGVSLAAFQQFSGINAVIYYGPRIMEKTGLSASNSILYSVVIGVVNIAATAASVRLVDRVGRRPLLLLSLPAMGVALVLLGLTFELSLGPLDSVLSLLCLLGYITAFAIGLGPVFWLLIAEIFPPEARAAGASVSTAMNWFFNFLVCLLFLPVGAAIGQAPTFWIFAVVCAVALVFVRRYVPETKDRSLSKIDADVRERWARRRVPADRPTT